MYLKVAAEKCMKMSSEIALKGTHSVNNATILSQLKSQTVLVWTKTIYLFTFLFFMYIFFHFMLFKIWLTQKTKGLAQKSHMNYHSLALAMY